MKLHYVILPLLLLVPLSGCGGLVGELVNPYKENFKCRTRDDAGKCIDTPSAYKDARFPDGVNASETSCTNASGDTIPCPPATTAESAKTNINQLTAQNSRYKALTELMQEPDKPMLEPQDHAGTDAAVQRRERRTVYDSLCLFEAERIWVGADRYK